MVSRRRWLILALAGLVMICLAACALTYALGPVQHSIEQAPIAPTLFRPPG